MPLSKLHRLTASFKTPRTVSAYSRRIPLACPLAGSQAPLRQVGGEACNNHTLPTVDHVQHVDKDIRANQFQEHLAIAKDKKHKRHLPLAIAQIASKTSYFKLTCLVMPPDVRPL